MGNIALIAWMMDKQPPSIFHTLTFPPTLEHRKAFEGNFPWP